MRFLARRGISAIAAAVLCAALFGVSVPAYAETDYSAPPEIGAPSAILIDADTSEVIFEKGADTQREPASLVKVMTALLAVEALDPEEILTMDREVYAVMGRQIFLQTGERITVESLLYADMLYSADDAAVALAKAVSGSVKDFVDLMNERARVLGCGGTTFVNPSGVAADGQASTARDLAVIAQAAMKDSRFLPYASAAEYTIPPTNYFNENLLVNSNMLLTGAGTDEGDAVSPQPGKWRAAAGGEQDEAVYIDVYGERRPIKYEGATGVKTGRTDTSGACLIVSASRGGESYIAVVLGGGPEMEDGYADAVTLLEYGFHRIVDEIEETPEEPEEEIPAETEESTGFFEMIGLRPGDGFSFYLKIGAAAIIVLIIVLLIVLIRHRYTRNPYVRRVRYGRVTREIRRVRRLK